MAVLHSLAEMAKHASSDYLLAVAAQILKLMDLPTTNTSYTENAIIRKLRVKVIARIAVLLLPTRLVGESTIFSDCTEVIEISRRRKDAGLY